MSFARQYDNPALPLWTRVVLYAVDHHGRELARGELHRAVDPHRLIRTAEISRAIRHGIKAGLLDEASNAGLLLLAGYGQDAA